MDVGDALVDALLVEVGQHDRHLEAAYEQQRELAGHQAGADDADLGHRPGQRLVGRAGGPLGPLLHQVERVERGEQLGGRDISSQGVVLGGEALVAVGVTGAGDQLDGLGRGGEAPPVLAVDDAAGRARSAASQASPRSTSARSTTVSPGSTRRRPEQGLLEEVGAVEDRVGEPEVVRRLPAERLALG